jgi:hypothetical protein
MIEIKIGSSANLKILTPILCDLALVLEFWVMSRLQIRALESLVNGDSLD